MVPLHCSGPQSLCPASPRQSPSPASWYLWWRWESRAGMFHKIDLVSAPSWSGRCKHPDSRSGIVNRPPGQKCGRRAWSPFLLGPGWKKTRGIVRESAMRGWARTESASRHAAGVSDSRWSARCICCWVCRSSGILHCQQSLSLPPGPLHSGTPACGRQRGETGGSGHCSSVRQYNWVSPPRRSRVFRPASFSWPLVYYMIYWRKWACCK